MTEKPTSCVLWSWLLLLATAAVPLTAILTIVVAYLPTMWQRWLWVIWGSALPIIAGVYLPLRRKNMRFSLTDDGIEVTGGVVFLSTRRMHRDAIRQVTLLQGPVERRHHTVFLLVSGTGGYLLVEGIPLTQAEDWCRRLYAP